ncbi:hypothetical protein F2P81_017333 [Scophthalmus maximus]|uniref:Uncharacterized protein n=1 Tax=Scophthalmus maximus TaxID=52904 RepID=A0A6A4SJQ8_SCOMX|nr:hypothetical protein F2P81_017333 [Scophthalmus maximus]
MLDKVCVRYSVVQKMLLLHEGPQELRGHGHQLPLIGPYIFVPTSERERGVDEGEGINRFAYCPREHDLLNQTGEREKGESANASYGYRLDSHELTSDPSTDEVGHVHLEPDSKWPVIDVKDTVSRMSSQIPKCTFASLQISQFLNSHRTQLRFMYSCDPTSDPRMELVAVQEVEPDASRMIYGSVSGVAVGPRPTVTQSQGEALHGPIRGCPEL